VGDFGALASGADGLEPSGAIIGKQISFARVERNLTRQDLGVILGISSEQVEKYESGEEAMPAGLLYRLSEVFDLPVTEFFRQPDEVRSTGIGQRS
jgi:transcriptional regulator with XRE-family HTH domain